MPVGRSSRNKLLAFVVGVRVLSMPYDKVIVSPSGEQFPYSDLSDEESYYYEISVVSDGSPEII